MPEPVAPLDVIPDLSTANLEPTPVDSQDFFEGLSSWLASDDIFEGEDQLLKSLVDAPGMQAEPPKSSSDFLDLEPVPISLSLDGQRQLV